MESSAQVAASPEISNFQLSVIDQVSGGDTHNQAARNLGIPTQSIKDVEKQLTNLGMPNLTAAADLVIRQGIIPVEVKQDEALTSELSKPDRVALKLYAMGVSNKQLATSLSRTMKEVRKYEHGLHYKLRAWNRPHTIRRAHELGVL